MWRGLGGRAGFGRSAGVDGVLFVLGSHMGSSVNSTLGPSQKPNQCLGEYNVVHHYGFVISNHSQSSQNKNYEN